LLGRTALQRQRRVMGIPVPNKVDLGNVGHHIGEVGQQLGEAGKQFGRLASEVQTVREKAERLGKALG
jgi:hypothetical protein